MEKKLRFYQGTHKECTTCNISKPLNEFYKGNGKDGLAYTCKKCSLEYKKEYQKRNKEKLREKDRLYYENVIKPNPDLKKSKRLKYKYGITLDDFNSILSHQMSRCKICNNPFKSKKDTHVDHDHVTGKIRGLLCNKCNRGLGYFSDKIDYLQRAIDYLEEERLDE